GVCAAAADARARARLQLLGHEDGGLDDRAARRRADRAAAGRSVRELPGVGDRSAGAQDACGDRAAPRETAAGRRRCRRQSRAARRRRRIVYVARRRAVRAVAGALHRQRGDDRRRRLLAPATRRARGSDAERHRDSAAQRTCMSAEAHALIAKYGLRAKKSWGQNFLVDERAYREIVHACAIGDGDWVVEIGAGLGTLTKRLAATGAHVVAVERERDMLDVLRSELGGDARIEVTEANALTFDYAAVAERAGRPPIIVGNLPYQIASPILFRLLETRARLA